jgi:hypothetical protein
MFYAIGAHNAIGYAVFGVDSLITKTGEILPDMQPLVDSFACVRAALPLLITFHATGWITALIEEEYRTEQFLDLGSYIGLVVFGPRDQPSTWTDYHHAAKPHANRGRGLVIQAGEREFYLVGAGLSLVFKKKGSPETLLSSSIASDYLLDRLTNYRRVEEGHFDEAENWIVDRVRNGDETDHGIWVEPDVNVVHVILE